uniref:ATP synthase F0 subunit 8 n=1 Tax=Phoneutria boliviensis TaxID=2598454 RepID=UPI001D111F3C|nr:ATP synthase F0 subunit 8 [Phoneutria boliviensis]UBY46222.1 ATP synthase F0 subunit 8 [Phoneutria boliviensis]
MPQLMPLMWINSVFMGAFLLVVLLFMYDCISDFCYYELGEEFSSDFSIKW